MAPKIINLALIAALGMILPRCSGPTPCTANTCIERVAGTGTLAFNGDGHPANETDFYFVTAVRPGPDGRIYLMDFNNHRLRVIESNGTVSTVAGNGIHALATPGIAALDSPLENPIDFAFGPDGTIVIVALHDPRVLKVQTDGILAVIAGTGEQGSDGDGGQAIAARLTELTGVVVASDGSVFIADGKVNRVRVIRPTGIIEAYAGTGVSGYSGDGGAADQATLHYPTGLTLDNEGNLYIADSGNHVIRRVLVNGTIETVAGTGSRGFGGDGAAATEALLDSPEGVAIGIDADIFVSDSGNHRIRRVNSAGTIMTIAGAEESGFVGDGGPAIDAKFSAPYRLSFLSDSLFVADSRNGCARKIIFK